MLTYAYNVTTAAKESSFENKGPFQQFIQRSIELLSW